MKKHGTELQNKVRLLLDKNGIAVRLWNWVGAHTLEVGYLTKTDYKKAYTLFVAENMRARLTILPDCESTLFIEEGERQMFFF
jgi:hypothetical protein